VVDLDSQLDPEHRARVVWDFVQTLDLSALHGRIKAAGEAPGRPASDPAVLLAVWLYATTDRGGSARPIARLCVHHTAYRWLCGGVPVNHDILSAFHRDSGPLLDQLLTQSLTSLLAEGLITLEEVAIDGTKPQAHAGRGSVAQRERLVKLEQAVAEHVAKLKQEVEADGAAAERKRQKRAVRAVAERAARLRRAQENLAERKREKAERAKRHAKEEAEKRAPSVSISDPEVRSMKIAGGATRLAWHVQVATSNGFIVTIDRTDRRDDSSMAEGLLQQVVDRCGVTPQRVLADGSAMTQDDIVGLSQSAPELAVNSPPPTERQDVTAETLNKRVETPERTGPGAGLADADGERGGPAGVPVPQADRACARQDEEPRLRANAGEWAGHGTLRLLAACAGAQPAERAPAAPRGGSVSHGHAICGTSEQYGARPEPQLPHHRQMRAITPHDTRTKQRIRARPKTKG
jgi:transposase